MVGRLVVTCLAASLLAACGRGLEAEPSDVIDTSQVLMARSYQFDPAAIHVAAGTAVTWINDDVFTHDVRLLGVDGWHSQPLRPGERVSHVFAQAGTYAYECAFHPQNMRGVVEVSAP